MKTRSHLLAIALCTSIACGSVMLSQTPQAYSQESVQEQPPDNVTGNWIIYAQDAANAINKQGDKNVLLYVTNASGSRFVVVEQGEK